MFKQGFVILTVNEFKGLEFKCQPTDEKCYESMPDPEHFCHSIAPHLTQPDGELVLRDLGFDGNTSTIWAAFLFMLMQLAFYQLIGYVGMLIMARRKKL